MTKKELIDALEPYNNDQYINIRLYSSYRDYGHQIIIQNVKEYPPWYPEEGLPNIIGLVAHEGNKILE